MEELKLAYIHIDNTRLLFLHFLFLSFLLSNKHYSQKSMQNIGASQSSFSQVLKSFLFERTWLYNSPSKNFLRG